MAGTHSSFNPEALLRETAWMHDLARSLVGDTGRAGDLVQQTWLRALQRPPQDMRSLRGWLATVLRNVLLRDIRDEKSRRQREQRVARSEKLPATPEQALERAETQQLLVDLVIKLEEPYRSAVLLRFFEDMTPEEIARAENVHVTTIRRHLRVGIDRLRAQLDARHAGDRNAWYAVLIPFIDIDGVRIGTGSALATTGGSGATLFSALGYVGGLLAMKKVIVSSVLLVVLFGIVLVTVDVTRQQIGPEDLIRVTAPSPPTESTESEVAGSLAQPKAVRGAILAGGTFDANSGLGVEGVTFVLRSREESNGVSLKTKTDPRGAFRFDDVAPGDYILEPIEMPTGYRIPIPNSDDASREITLEAGEIRDGVHLTLLREVPLRGKVIEYGAGVSTPAVGAHVVVVGGPDCAELQETVAAADGTFAFHGLAPLENFHLAAEKNGFRTRTRDRPLNAEGQTKVVLAIDICEDPASVSGRVVDLDGEPLAKMRVLAQNGPPNSQNVLIDGFAMTDAEGRFKMTHLIPGTFNFNLTPHDLPERGYEWGRLELEAGEEVTDLELVYDRVYSISGGVYNPDDEPIAGVKVGAGGETVTTDATGQFVITRLGPHDYTLEASAKNYTDGRIRGVAAGSENVDFVLKPSGYEILGRVLDAETHEPLTQFELSWDKWPDSWGSPHLYSGNIYHYRPFSSPDGRFTFRDFERTNRPWKLLLVARAKGFASALELIDLEESRYDDERVIYVQPDGDLVGVVQDAEGFPVSAAEIYYQHVVRKIGTFDDNRTVARTVDDGFFTIASFPQGGQEIAVYHADFARYFVEVPPHDSRTRPFEIVMTPGGAVTGRVLPMPEASSVRVSVVTDRWRLQRTDVNEDGTFALEKIPPQNGTVRLSVSYGDLVGASDCNRYTLIERPVMVKVGQTTETDFRLQEATSALQGNIQTGYSLIESIEVATVITTESGVEKHFVHADGAGTYILDRLPVGEAAVTVTVKSQDGKKQASSPFKVHIGNGETLTRDFDLSH